MAEPYTPDRAYRLSVLPLGIFMIFGGIVLFAAAMWMPPEQLFVPPFKDPWLKRAVMGGSALFLLPIGFGLCCRNRVAWFGLFAYMLIGTIWHIVAGMLDPQFAYLVVLSPAINIPLLVGIYFATKPVFRT